MSKNVSRLSGRKGLEDNLFERIVASGRPEATAHAQLAREFRLGEAMTYGAASFYDLLGDAHAGAKVLVCDGSACLCAGTQDALRARLEHHFQPDEIGTITCLGRCHENGAFHLHGRNYSGADIDALDAIVTERDAVDGDRYVVESRCEPPILTGAFPGVDEFYAVLGDALQRPAAELLESIQVARLRGRGGAGFPAGVKWASARAAAGDKKYIVCNADEGDPGAYIDRYLMEHQPHLVLFGMLIAGRIVGADEGVVYVRAEYPESVSAMRSAVEQATAAGWIGEAIAGSDVSFRCKVVAGAGSYICGEETALIASLEGRRPEVGVRPPYPTTEGLFGKPTVVNNVETFANVHAIVARGGTAYAGIGTPDSTGPKLASLNGLFRRPGIYEVPMGTPLSVIVDELGQGFAQPVKALHIGGPLGGLVPIDKVGALTFDFESFRDAGFLLGHGSIVAVPASLPMIEYLEHLFHFCAAESCGKCFPCRIGSVRGQEMLRAAIEGRQKLDRALLDDLLETMELGSLCAHGGGLPLPIRNALASFSEELREHFV